MKGLFQGYMAIDTNVTYLLVGDFILPTYFKEVVKEKKGIK